MDLYRAPNSKYWTADFFIKGQRFRKSTKQTTKAKAGEVAAEFLRQAQRSEAPALTKQIPSVRQFAEGRFLPFVEAGTKATETKNYYRAGWRLLKSSTVANLRLDEITPSVTEVLKFPGSGSNQNCALRTLRRMLSLAVEDKLLQGAPRISLRKEKERTAVWDSSAEEALLRVAPQPMKDVFLISHDSGMRPDEIINLRWPDILWDKSVIYIPKGKTKNSTRNAPLSDRVRDLLRVRQQGSSSEFVFPSKRSKTGHITHTAIEKPFRKARTAAKLNPELVLYSARHSFATDLLDITGNLKVVMDTLGHASMKTTQKYLHPSTKGIAEQVNERNRRRTAGSGAASASHFMPHLAGRD